MQLSVIEEILRSQFRPRIQRKQELPGKIAEVGHGEVAYLAICLDCRHILLDICIPKKKDSWTSRN
jgi:uncharacterized protein YebE (UPF0316 family)